MKKLLQILRDAKTQYGFDKAKILLEIGEMDASILEDMCLEVWDLQYPSYGDSESMFLVKGGDVQEMLNEFWQRSSDACPVEASEAENQICEWEQWVPERLAKMSNL